jgi:uncharacterized membrane protein
MYSSAAEELDAAGSRRYIEMVMSWREWIGLSTIKVYVSHTIVTMGAVLIFVLLRSVIRWGVGKGTLQDVLEMIDSVMLAGLFIWFMYQMGVILWNGRVRIGRPFTVLAV